MLSARKALNRKKPTRRANFTYWSAEQFAKLQSAPPIRLASKGNLTWRWLAYLLDASPKVEPIRDVIRRRLMDAPGIGGELKRLNRMLVTLHQLGIVVLDPAPPTSVLNAVKPGGAAVSAASEPAPDDSDDDAGDSAADTSTKSFSELLDRLKLGNLIPQSTKAAGTSTAAEAAPYEPMTAAPTAKLKQFAGLPRRSPALWRVS